MRADEQKWKKEFDSDKRAREYDATINFFSLRRAERFKVLHTLLPKAPDGEHGILELGSGTGIFTKQLTTRYPKARIFAVEGAQRMINLAKSKRFFKDNKDRIRWILADYSSPIWRSHIKDHLNLIVSFDALHHLTHQRQKVLYGEIFEMILPGGMLFISDHMTSCEPFYDDPQFSLWIEEVMNVLAQSRKMNMMNLLKDKIYAKVPSRIKGYLRPDIREDFLKQLLKEGDNPMHIMDQIDAIREAGFTGVTVEYRFANFGIISARKSESSVD